MSTNNDQKTIVDQFRHHHENIINEAENEGDGEQFKDMATRQLGHEVLTLSPEHKTSKVILDLVYEALQNHFNTFESSTRSIGDNVKAKFPNIVREMFSDGMRR